VQVFGKIFFALGSGLWKIHKKEEEEPYLFLQARQQGKTLFISFGIRTNSTDRAWKKPNHLICTPTTTFIVPEWRAAPPTMKKIPPMNSSAQSTKR
jgi:hypothetical protein